MKYGIVAATLFVGLVTTSLLAEDGMPSQAKLNRLGLGSLQPASDAQGAQVRGNFYYRVSWNNQVLQGFDVDSGLEMDGIPLSIGPAPLLPIEWDSQLGPEVVMDVSTNPPGPRTRTGISNWFFSINNNPGFTIAPITIAPIQPVFP